MKPLYKPYVGKIFKLKKSKIIPAYEDKFARNKKNYNNEIFGSIVLVLDETNTRVKVTTKDPQKTLWIWKYYICFEIESDKSKEKNKINSIANKLFACANKVEYNKDSELKNLLLEAGEILKTLVQ